MDFEVAGRSYRSSKMDAISQLHVMRKLAPLFTAVGSLASLTEIVQSVKGGDGAAAISPMAAVDGIAKALSGMSDTDFDAVMSRCLSVVSVQVGSAGYAPVWSADAKRLMFADIDWIAVIQIVANVIKDNLGNFSSALPSGSNV